MSRVRGVTGDTAPRGSTDSSSSRESTPERGISKKRSFSPESEDSESAAPPCTDGTPPSPEQPVIRQGLAFPNAATRNINTYEAPVNTSKLNTFLPGQEVHTAASAASSSAAASAKSKPQITSTSPTPAPTTLTPATSSPHLSATSTPSDRSTASRGTKKASKGSANKKTTKHADDVSFTTGRFRISQYSSTPSDVPPLHHGQGPYSSMYRAPMPSVEVTPPAPSSTRPQSSLSPPPSSTSSTALTGRTAVVSEGPPLPASKSSGASRSSRASRSSARTSRGPTKQLSQPPRDESEPSAPTGHTIHVPPLSQPIQSAATSPTTSGTPQSSVTPSELSRQLGSSYYRRNYDEDAHQPPARPNHRQLLPRSDPSQLPNQPDSSQPTHSSSSQPPHPNSSQPPIRPNSSRAPSESVQAHQTPNGSEPPMAPPSATASSKGKEKEPSVHVENRQSEVSRPAKGTVRLVTALIEDKRVNPPDHLLAEVNVRCWSGSKPEELWCDAKDLSELLQASASRIDGPAKVFTRRGGYRQCFLRVTHDQVDKFNSMNLALASDRTVHITVEHFNLPGSARLTNAYDWRTMPWHGPQRHDEGKFPSESSRKRSAYDGRSSPEYPPDSPRYISYSNQSSSATNHDHRYEHSSLPHHSPPGYTRKRSRVSDDSPNEDTQNMPSHLVDANHDYGNAGYDSSNSDDIRLVIADMVEELLRNDIGFDRFLQLFDSVKLTGIIQAYRMAEDICRKYVRRALPLRGTSHVITEEDVSRALHVSEPSKFMPEVRELLWFLELYGEKGKRYEHPKVLEMLKDDYRPDYNIKPIKRLQRLLRDIDAQWMREHPEALGNNYRFSRMT